MVCVPAPAVAGLNVPAAALVMPVPVHVPPASTAARLNAGEEIHTGARCVIVTSFCWFTVTITVSVEGQVPAISYCTTYVPAVAGSNVPAVLLVMPVPDQVPPGAAAVRLNGAEPEQAGAGCVMVALADPSTTRLIVSVLLQ